jgi:hypothetical protein
MVTRDHDIFVNSVDLSAGLIEKVNSFIYNKPEPSEGHFVDLRSWRTILGVDHRTAPFTHGVRQLK